MDIDVNKLSILGKVIDNVDMGKDYIINSINPDYLLMTLQRVGIKKDLFTDGQLFYIEDDYFFDEMNLYLGEILEDYEIASWLIEEAMKDLKDHKYDNLYDNYVLCEFILYMFLLRERVVSIEFEGKKYTIATHNNTYRGGDYDLHMEYIDSVCVVGDMANVYKIPALEVRIYTLEEYISIKKNIKYHINTYFRSERGKSQIEFKLKEYKI